MKLRTKISLFVVSILVVIFTVLGIVIYVSQKSEILKMVDQEMVSHVDDINVILGNHLDLKQKAVNISLHLAENILSSKGEIKETSSKITITGINQITKEQKDYQVNLWEINKKPIYNNFEIVDNIKDQSVETATIFQKIDDGYLRISTNVMLANGKRAIGTFIPNSSEVIKTIENNNTYLGRAFVVNDWYLTAYKPLKINGSVKGILYVGIKEKNYTFLKSIFSNKKYLTSGFPFLVTEQGDLTIHPTHENENIAENDFFKQIKNSEISQYRIQYVENPGKEKQTKYLYYKYFEPYKSYICISLNETDLTSKIRSLLLLIIFSVTISIVISYFGIIVLLNPVIKRIEISSEVAKSIANGDLTNEFENSRNDEIGVLTQALSDMQHKLKDIFIELIKSSDNIYKASIQLNTSSQQVSEGASEQASSVEEVSSTMEEFSTNITQNAENSAVTEKIANSTAQLIQDNGKSTSETMRLMNKIADKISIIDEIAFQTNILALNAAVEAARAGEQGRGFAVVAGEVRKLAEKSKIAADQISQLTNAGVTISEKLGNELKSIIPEINKTTRLVQEITSASLEMNLGSGQVSTAINQLNQITQQNAIAAESMAANAVELADQSEKLKQFISFFKI